MHFTSVSFWFRIVSIPMVVLPVCRSPMISSRWPRPTFVIASIALMPVSNGSLTGCRATTPGALNSSSRVSDVSIGPPPSSGLPSGSTTRPRSASPTGTLATLPVRLTGSPSLTCCHSPKSAVPTSSSSRLKARPTTPCSIRSLRIEVISSGRSFTGFLSWSDGWLEAGPAKVAAPLSEFDSGGQLDCRATCGRADPVESILPLGDLILLARAEQPRRAGQGRADLGVNGAGLPEVIVDLLQLLIVAGRRADAREVIVAALEIVHARIDRLERLLVLRLDVEAHL